MLETRTLCPRYVYFGLKSLVGCSVVTNMTLLDMAGFNVVLSGIAWLRMGLDVRAVVNRLGMLLNVMLLAALLNLVEGSSNSMHETKEVSIQFLSLCGVVTYVLRIARIKVPQGKLQLSSVVLELFWKTPEIPCAS